jgi:hypothetical protein
MTLENDCKRYVEALRGPANGWGQFLIDGRQSHFFLQKMWDTHGEDAVDQHLEDNYWKLEREARQCQL